jgi:hypothetical protein
MPIFSPKFSAKIFFLIITSVPGLIFNCTALHLCMTFLDNLLHVLLICRGPFLTSSLHRGKLWPPGEKLSPRREEFVPYIEVNEGVSIPLRGQSSPLGANFTPRDKLHPWGQTMLLKTGLWSQDLLSVNCIITVDDCHKIITLSRNSILLQIFFHN